MKNLSVVLNNESKKRVADALLRLFLFQGKSSTEKEIVMWVDEISEWGYSVDLIIKAIESLNDEKIIKLKLSDIKDAIQNKIIVNPDSESGYKEPRCKYCDDTGHVSMIDKVGYSSASACLCYEGDKFLSTMGKGKIKINQWNGQKYQVVNNKTLTFIDADIWKLK